MKLTINGTVYQVEGDVRVTHDRATDRLVFDFTFTGGEPVPLAALGEQPPLALEAPAHKPYFPTRKKYKAIRREGIREKVIAMLQEVGAISTRGMTWRVLGNGAPVQDRHGLHRLLHDMVQEGVIAVGKRSKTAQNEYHLPGEAARGE